MMARPSLTMLALAMFAQVIFDEMRPEIPPPFFPEHTWDGGSCDLTEPMCIVRGVPSQEDSRGAEVECPDPRFGGQGRPLIHVAMSCPGPDWQVTFHGTFIPPTCETMLAVETGEGSQ